MESLVKPTIETKFHIDMDWWERNHRDIRLYMWNALCTDCRHRYKSHKDTEIIDWVDPQTAEVKQVDALWQSLRTCCSHKSSYVTEEHSLATAIFRIFLGNGNTPLSSIELHEKLVYRPAETILRILSGGKTYNGIRPVPAKK